MTPRNIFVTIGTTKFDELIQTVTEENILKTFVKLGYNSLTIQIGNGIFEPQASDIIKVNWYRLKPSIKEDIRKASLVISHAGAGSCLEILGEKKILIAVVNEKLMDNHQMELAVALSNRNYLKYCSCKTLQQTLLEERLQLKPYPIGEPQRFVEYLDKCVGFCDV